MEGCRRLLPLTACVWSCFLVQVGLGQDHTLLSFFALPPSLWHTTGVKNKQCLSQKTILRIAYALLGCALLVGFGTRTVPLFRYTGFDADQAWNASKILAMGPGNWPSLGPYSSIGGYSLPPLLYYITWPFTIFGPDPRLQVLPNILCSILAIPLLMYLLYLLLEHVPRGTRLFLAGVGGVWWSVFFPDVLLNSVEWNPPLVPFFLLLSALLWYWAWKAKTATLCVACWIGIGVCLAVLASLHSSTLFVMPIVFGITALWYIVRTRRWVGPVVGLAIALLMLLPYWKGEIATHWQNTRTIIQTVQETSRLERHAPIDRMNRAIGTFLQLGESAYFPQKFGGWFGPLYLALIPLFGIGLFRGERKLFGYLLIVWMVFLLAASNYWGVPFIHYSVLIWFAPVVFTMLALSSLRIRTVTGVTLATLLGIGILLSFAGNILLDWNYFNARFGTPRLANTADLVAALRSIPDGSTVCATSATEQSLAYLAKEVAHNQLRVTTDCTGGTRYRIEQDCRDTTTFRKPLTCAGFGSPVRVVSVMDGT